MHAELFFYIHLHASMGSAAAAGWSRQREDAAAQCESLCSAASTMSFLSMLLCDGRDSSVSSVATPVGASISWECAQHGDRFGGKLNSLQSRAGQQRSHPYGKAVLAARASLQCRALIHEVAAPPRAPVARARAQMLVIEGKAATEHCGSLRLKAWLHTMRVHTMHELGAGQCNPYSQYASRRRDLQQGVGSAAASFFLKFY